MEVELIWKTPKKLASIIYNRYFSLIALGVNVSFMLREVKSDRVSLVFNLSQLLLDYLFTEQICSMFLHLMGITITIIISTVDLVLLMRVWILYGRSKKLLYVLIPLISGECVAMLVLDYHIVYNMKRYIHVGPIVEGCYSASSCSALLRLHGGPISDSGNQKVPTLNLTRRPDTFVPPVLHYACHDDLQMQSNFVFLEWEDCTNAYYFALHARWDILVPICFRFGFPASFFDALID
ncbi:hypothetical protein WG66_006330 [Moniliophthora roreri]|nr:hypothetical protein WG66_006330 [Moniliophthora roreri]